MQQQASHQTIEGEQTSHEQLTEASMSVQKHHQRDADSLNFNLLLNFEWNIQNVYL